MLSVFPGLEKEGEEADDVLGRHCPQAGKQGLGVKIITGDRDLLQLVKTASSSTCLARVADARTTSLTKM